MNARIKRVDEIMSQTKPSYDEAQEAADLLIEVLEELGFEGDYKGKVDVDRAQTGSVYLSFAIFEDGDFVRDVKIRVANHGECYCREDISIDPQGVKAARLYEILTDKKSWIWEEEN